MDNPQPTSSPLDIDLEMPETASPDLLESADSLPDLSPQAILQNSSTIASRDDGSELAAGIRDGREAEVNASQVAMPVAPMPTLDTTEEGKGVQGNTEVDSPLSEQLPDEAIGFKLPSEPVPPVTPAATPPPVQRVSTPNPSPTLPTSPIRSSKKLGVGLLVLAVVCALGGSYMLAGSGAAIPGLTPLVTGLPLDGLAVAKMATSNLKSQSQYLVSGYSEVKGESAGGSLPDETSELVPVTSLRAEFDQPIGLQISHAGSQIGHHSLTMNEKKDQAVEVYLSMPSDVSEPSVVNFTGNSVNPLYQVDSKSIQESLFMPVLRIVPASLILTSVRSTSDYQKENGKKIAHYSYELSATDLSGYVPAGATITKANAQAYYAWKTAEPVRVVLELAMTYLGKPYTVLQSQEVVGYSGIDRSDSNIAVLSDVPKERLNTSSLIAQFGLSPNQVAHSTQLVEVPSPTGASVTTITDSITSIPLVPIASEAGKQRDIQRLADLTLIKEALARYAKVEGSYPKVEGVVQVQSSPALLTALVPTYITGLPVDPTKTTFWYEYSSNGTDIILRAVAEDAQNTQAKSGKAFAYFELTDSTTTQVEQTTLSTERTGLEDISTE
jgi:hypothetical protein